MAEYYKSRCMEFESYPYDCTLPHSEDVRDPLLRLDSPKGFERYSFSVVYQAFDFPFPLIHYPRQSADYLDSQFSVGCVHGGGSMLSSLDVSVESCLDAASASSKRSDISAVTDHPKEESEVSRLSQVLASMDEENSSKIPSMFHSPLRARVECGADSVVSDVVVAPGDSATSVPPKEPNPVEFRSGYRGVSWNRRMKAWLAFWSEGKNRRSKTFNAKVMGFERARAAAIDFLKKKKQLLQQLDPNFNDFDDYDYEDQASNGIPPSGASSFDEMADIHSTTTSDTATPSATPCSSDGTQDNLLNHSGVCAMCGSQPSTQGRLGITTFARCLCCPGGNLETP